jgi:hypothetical protein
MTVDRVVRPIAFSDLQQEKEEEPRTDKYVKAVSKSRRIYLSVAGRDLVRPGELWRSKWKALA